MSLAGLFKSMDLYKGVILASIALLPAAGWWINKNQQGIEAANRAITEAIRPNGTLQRIAELQRKVELVANSSVGSSSATAEPEVYFQSQIYRSAKNGQLAKEDFNPSPARPEVAFTGSSKQRATDYVVKIDFVKQGGKDLKVPRDFLFAVLFNCESGASTGGAGALPSVWKLRSLKVQNGTEQLAAALPTRKTPPGELEDLWIIKDMQFARREPSKK
jgi:hypothetical protein